MFLEWLLSPITDKNTATGAILQSVADSRAARARRALRLEERQVAALEKIAEASEGKYE